MEATGTPFLNPEDCFDRSCANCNKAGSSSFCSRCAVSDIGHMGVFYCSISCQQQHWETHKETCKGIRQLRRATSLMAEIWSMIEADYCPISAKFISEKDGVIETALLGKKDDPQALRGRSLLQSVTNTTIPEDSAPAIQAAVFAMQQFSPLSLTAKSILEMIFNDICHLVEMKGDVKDPALVVRLEGKQITHHYFLMVTLHTGEIFVVDFEGIMHGWKQLLSPRDVYVKHRTTGDLQSTHIGGRAPAQNEFLKKKALNSTERAIIEFSAHAITFIRATMMSVLTEEGFAMGDFLALPDETFAPIRERLIASIQAGIRRVKWVVEKSGLTRVYYDEKFHLRVVMKEDVKAKLEKVWITKKEFKAKKGRFGVLKGLYQKKLANVQQKK